MKNILIASAWPYANNSLHIGHLAALLPADIIARYHRIKNNNVIFVSGTDCHGTPITMRAKAEGIKAIDLVLNYHNEFCETFDSLNFSYDNYGYTASTYHKEEVIKLFNIIKENGYIYETECDEDYCENCQSFLADREIIGICPHCDSISKAEQCDGCLTQLDASKLKEKKCITCNTETTTKKNKHLYFALSKFQKPLEEYMESNKEYWRLNGINETKKYLENGLIDRAATRQLDWGVDVEVTGYEDKKIYVWIEAVLGYFTMAKEYCEKNNMDFMDFMTSDNTVSYYVHGKDNIVFHSIIFPALLLAINPKLNLPRYIVSSEYVNMNDEKMSKSKGNGVTIKDLTSLFDTDSIRYYFISNNPEKKDINFTYDDFISSHNKHLVGEYGNFVNRNLAFLVKKFDSIVPNGKMDIEVDTRIKEVYDEVNTLIEKAQLRTAMEKIFELVRYSNKYYDDKTPWIKAKEDIEEFNNITFTCVTLIANISNLLMSFMPNSSTKVLNMLGIKEASNQYIKLNDNIKLNSIDILFSRIEKE